MKSSMMRISCLFALIACLSLPALGVTRVKSGSNYGASDSSVSDCANSLTPHPEGCQAYSALGLAPITINGATSMVNEYDFSDGNAADNGITFDVYDLGIGNYTDVNVALSGSLLGVFACGGTQLDSGTPSPVSYSTNNSNFGVPCSPILATSTGDSSTLDANGLPFVFTLNADGSVTFGSSANPIPSTDDIVVYAVPSATTPEPFTLTLMGLGLAALAGLFLRRTV